jgi:phosphatidylglycerol lysyltransferase
VTTRTDPFSRTGSLADRLLPAADNAAGINEPSRLLRYAADSTAAQLLQPALQHWRSPHYPALAGYVDAGPRRITAALPLAAAEHEAAVVREYLAATRRSGRRAVLVGIDGERGPQLAAAHGLAALQIGTQPFWRPAEWPQLLAAHRSLRSAINGARHKQVIVSEQLPVVAAADPAVQACRGAWAAQHRLPPLQFVLTTETFGRRHEQRSWIARRHGDVIAYLAAWPAAARRGWLFELVRRPQAPAGTSELLIDTAMRAVAADGAERVTLGLLPLSGAAGRGAATAGLRLLLQLLRRYGRHVYRFDGLAAFRARLHPPQVEDVWLLSDEPAVSLTSALALIVALLGPSPAALLRRTPAQQAM